MQIGNYLQDLEPVLLKQYLVKLSMLGYLFSQTIKYQKMVNFLC